MQKTEASSGLPDFRSSGLKQPPHLKKGDKVVTTAGIHGKITDIAETTFLVEVDNGVKIRFDKSAISLEASKALNAPVVAKS